MPNTFQISHENRTIEFLAPCIGPEKYRSIGLAITDHNFKVPIGDYNVSLLHSAYCDPRTKNDQISEYIRAVMKDNWLWVFNQNLWTDRGVYVILDPRVNGRNDTFPLNELEQMVSVSNGATEVDGVRFSADRSVRFAPKRTYGFGEHTPRALKRNGFIIASYDLNGAEKLAEVASTFNQFPVIYGTEIPSEDQPQLRVGSLGNDENRLRINAGRHEYMGCAFPLVSC